MKDFNEFITENDNLDKSYKSLSKFGITEDPNKMFRPDILDLTRMQIAEQVLSAAYDDFDDFDELSDEEQNKLANKLSESLTDKDCQEYVDGFADFFRNSVNYDAALEYEEGVADDILSDKKFR